MTHLVRSLVRSVSRLDRIFAEEGGELGIIVVMMLGLNVCYFIWLLARSVTLGA